MRIGFMFVRLYIDMWWRPELNVNGVVSHFSEFQQQPDQWIPALYQGMHFFFINFISQGILLFNFGFAIANKKTSVISSSRRKNKPTHDIVASKQRRETFLGLALGGGGGSDDEDDDEEYYSKTLFVTTGGNNSDMIDEGIT